MAKIVKYYFKKKNQDNSPKVTVEQTNESLV